MEAEVAENIDGRHVNGRVAAAVRRVSVRDAYAVVLTELVLLDRQAFVAHAEGGPARVQGGSNGRVVPAVREDRGHIVGPRRQPVQGDGLSTTHGNRKTIVEEVGQRLAAGISEIDDATRGSISQERSRKTPCHLRVVVGQTGEGNAVEGEVGRVAKLVGVGVVKARVQAGTGIVIPRVHHPLAAAGGDAEVVHEQGVVGGCIVQHTEHLRGGRSREFKRDVPVRIVGAGAVHGHRHDFRAVNREPQIGRLTAARIRSQGDFVSRPDRQPGDGCAQRARAGVVGGARLNKSDVIPIRDGAVVSKRAASRRVQTDFVRRAGRPAGDRRVHADIAGRDGKGVSLEAGVRNGLTQRRTA